MFVNWHYGRSGLKLSLDRHCSMFNVVTLNLPESVSYFLTGTRNIGFLISRLRWMLNYLNLGSNCKYICYENLHLHLIPFFLSPLTKHDPHGLLCHVFLENPTKHSNKALCSFPALHHIYFQDLIVCQGNKF